VRENHLTDSDKLSVDVFHQVVNDSAAWIRTGTRLLESADVLWAEVEKAVEATNRMFDVVRQSQPGAKLDIEPPQSPHSAAFLLLSGYAIEVLLKALAVRRRRVNGENVSTDSGEIIGIRTDHNLLELARQQLGNTAISVREQVVLLRLSEVILWGGRYPMPLKLPDKIDVLRVFSWGSSDRDDVRELTDRIISKHDSLL
jgi:hypothetical protein